MPSVFSIKQDIIKASQNYYDAVSTEDKNRSKEHLQNTIKKFHKYYCQWGLTSLAFYTQNTARGDSNGKQSGTGPNGTNKTFGR